VHLREADGGGTTAIIEKVPVLLADGRVTTDLEIPSQIDIPCDVLEREQGIAADASALVRLHFNIEDQRGRSVFRVSERDVINYR
jgi:hypothetical protein